MLIIETGSIVANANSFTTDAELVTYADARGFDLPATEAERDQLQILAVDYIFSVEPQMKGWRVSSAQELPYPRSGVSINGFSVPSDSIPKELKNAQMELAVQAATDPLLLNAIVSNLASFDVSGVYSETYFSGGSWESVRTDRADAYLDTLLKSGGGVRLVRV